MSNLKEIRAALESWAVKETQKMQEDLLQGIKRDNPVKTGRSRDGWVSTQEVNKMGDTGLIDNDVEYVGWVEFGSDTIQPYAMARRNIARVSKQ